MTVTRIPSNYLNISKNIKFLEYENLNDETIKLLYNNTINILQDDVKNKIEEFYVNEKYKIKINNSLFEVFKFILKKNNNIIEPPPADNKNIYSKNNIYYIEKGTLNKYVNNINKTNLSNTIKNNQDNILQNIELLIKNIENIIKDDILNKLTKKLYESFKDNVFSTFISSYKSQLKEKINEIFKKEFNNFLDKKNIVEEQIKNDNDIFKKDLYDKINKLISEKFNIDSYKVPSKEKNNESNINKYLSDFELKYIKYISNDDIISSLYSYIIETNLIKSINSFKESDIPGINEYNDELKKTARGDDNFGMCIGQENNDLLYIFDVKENYRKSGKSGESGESGENGENGENDESGKSGENEYELNELYFYVFDMIHDHGRGPHMVKQLSVDSYIKHHNERLERQVEIYENTCNITLIKQQNDTYKIKVIGITKETINLNNIFKKINPEFGQKKSKWFSNYEFKNNDLENDLIKHFEDDKLGVFENENKNLRKDLQSILISDNSKITSTTDVLGPQKIHAETYLKKLKNNNIKIFKNHNLSNDMDPGAAGWFGNFDYPFDEKSGKSLIDGNKYFCKNSLLIKYPNLLTHSDFVIYYNTDYNKNEKNNKGASFLIPIKNENGEPVTINNKKDQISFKCIIIKKPRNLATGEKNKNLVIFNRFCKYFGDWGQILYSMFYTKNNILYPDYYFSNDRAALIHGAMAFKMNLMFYRRGEYYINHGGYSNIRMMRNGPTQLKEKIHLKKFPKKKSYFSTKYKEQKQIPFNLPNIQRIFKKPAEPPKSQQQQQQQPQKIYEIYKLFGEFNNNEDSIITIFKSDLTDVSDKSINFEVQNKIYMILKKYKNIVQFYNTYNNNKYDISNDLIFSGETDEIFNYLLNNYNDIKNFSINNLIEIKTFYNDSNTSNENIIIIYFKNKIEEIKKKIDKLNEKTKSNKIYFKFNYNTEDNTEDIEIYDINNRLSSKYIEKIKEYAGETYSKEQNKKTKESIISFKIDYNKKIEDLINLISFNEYIINNLGVDNKQSNNVKKQPEGISKKNQRKRKRDTYKNNQQPAKDDFSNTESAKKQKVAYEPIESKSTNDTDNDENDDNDVDTQQKKYNQISKGYNQGAKGYKKVKKNKYIDLKTKKHYTDINPYNVCKRITRKVKDIKLVKIRNEKTKELFKFSKKDNEIIYK